MRSSVGCGQCGEISRMAIPKEQRDDGSVETTLEKRARIQPVIVLQKGNFVPGFDFSGYGFGAYVINNPLQIRNHNRCLGVNITLIVFGADLRAKLSRYGSDYSGMDKFKLMLGLHELNPKG
ncbi:hypothetical protein M8C21_027613 [Ambrosia artemisiifolia]|uniref:Uncharacterized protein n=1 Tax=Ambrosia artemisiifolia TaxID=4212 RepID=A0AAD5DFI1_AMBAR|nr:hypothetical protein M8C21_027613 [Ambrosia artemisiifolia]